MKISTIFDLNKVQFDKENEVVLMTSVKAPKINLDKERAPLNLSLVLDVSGSMSGQKIAMLKDTVSKLIQQLTEQDTVGIVTFTDFISEVFAPQQMTQINKNKALAEINNICALSSTNMSGGILKGFEQLKVSELGKDKIHRILLFTDGQANEGLRQVNQFVEMVKTNLSDTPMTISCFGYGEDHSESILKSIADEGKGNFYFIKNIDDMGKAFARELGGLLSCYAQNITIELEMKENTGTFIEVMNNLDVDSKSDSHIKVTFDDIYSEEEKHLLVKVRLKPVTKAVTQRSSSIIKGSIKFNNMTSGGKEHKEEISAKINFVKAESTQKESTLEVLEQIALIELAMKLQQAKTYADQGNYILAQYYMTPSSYCLELNARGSSIGCSISNQLSSTSTMLNSCSYTKTASNTLASCTRGLNNYRSVDTSSQRYMNSVQKSMVKNFENSSNKVTTSTDFLGLVDLSKQNSNTFSVDSLGLNLADTLVINNVDTTISSNLQFNLGQQNSQKGLCSNLKKRRIY